MKKKKLNKIKKNQTKTKSKAKNNKLKIIHLPSQKKFIEKIKEFLPPHLSLAGLFTTVLGISNDAAYRRIRCETEMSIDEMYAICRYIGISADIVLLQDTELATFKYVSITENIQNFERYLNSINHHLDTIIKHNEIQPNSVMLYYAAEEIPIFETLFNDILIPFKLYYWMRNILNIPYYQQKRFSFEDTPHHLLKSANAIYKKYKLIPSAEIWTNETILTFIKQMEFCLETGLFQRKEDALKLIDAHNEMINELRKMAELSHKPNRPDIPFLLYRCDIMIGTNCIVIEKDKHPYTAFISFNTLNSLSTTNEIFCKEASTWVHNLIKKSTLISGTSEKERYKFFNDMIKKTEIIKLKVLDTVYFEDV